jgi:hypothetical protein
MTARTSAEPPLQQFEILSEEPTGDQMVHRVTPPDKVTAVGLVEKLLDAGTVVVDFAPAGQSLGSDPA